MIGDQTPLQVALRDGRDVSISQCRCVKCNNEWYVVNNREFTPLYCPYCGIRFLHMTESDLTPASDDDA